MEGRMENMNAYHKDCKEENTGLIKIRTITTRVAIASVIQVIHSPGLGGKLVEDQYLINEETKKELFCVDCKKVWAGETILSMVFEVIDEEASDPIKFDTLDIN